MANSSPFVVGGGINTGSPFTVNRMLYVSQVSPPLAASTIPVVASDTGVTYIGLPNSGGTYPSVSGATETFRVQGGMIVLGSGTDTVQIGRGANASATDAIAIGRGVVASTAQVVVIGSTATNAGQGGVVIGYGASFSASGGVAIGVAAAVSGNGGGAAGIAIGGSASAAGSSAGGGTHIAIGPNATAKAEDVVIGGNASSNQQSAFGVGSVVIGTSATANVAGGSVYAVVIGWTAGTSQKLATVIGSAATTTGGGTRAIVIGSGSTTSGTDSIVIGGGSTAGANQEVIIGAGGSSIATKVMQLGAASTEILTFVLGMGNVVASPAARTIRFTNGSGTDNAAGAVTVQAALSTGNATPGSLIFSVGQQVAGSSSTLQTPSAGLTLSHTTAGGHLGTFGGGIKTSTPNGGTADTWKLGSRVAAAVALDTSQYIQLDVGGTLYKLAVVT